jgi:hypothetical protein
LTFKIKVLELREEGNILWIKALAITGTI